MTRRKDVSSASRTWRLQLYSLLPVQILGANVAARCHSEVVIKLISDSLDEENFEKFRDRPFGRLLELQHSPQNFQCQLFYHCMKLLNRSKRRKGILVFNFNNSEVVFGPRDYYLLSGLNFGPFEEFPTTSALWENSLNKVETLTFRVIKDAFKQAVEDSEGGAGGGDTCLKLAHALFIYGVLFPRDTEAKKLDLKFLHVCNNLQTVSDFPWGLFSYKYFVEEFEKSCDRMRRLVKKPGSGKPNFEMFGFLFVFQCWIYEIFPSVGVAYASILHGWETISPRVLRWKTALGHRTYKNVQALLDGAKLVHPLVASNEEHGRLSNIESYLAEEAVLEGEESEEAKHVMDNGIPQQAVDEEAEPTERKSVKRKLILEAAECSMKRRPVLRSATAGVGQNAPRNAEDDRRFEQSFPSVSTPEAQERQFMQTMCVRMDRLEASCREMNYKWGSMNEKMGLMNKNIPLY